MSENIAKNLTKTELIADLKAMSLEISSLCGANQGLQSDSGFIDENRNDSGKQPFEMTVQNLFRFITNYKLFRKRNYIRYFWYVD